jgi:hypothetical protein
VNIEAAYLTDIIRAFRNYRTLAEAALAQVSDEQLFTAIDGEANSIAVIVQHLAGNLRSRFTDFLTADGEKPDRDRDGEFESPRGSRPELMARWTEAWNILLSSLETLRPGDLGQTVRIRNEPFLVVEALNRSATHLAYHVGQIVFLAKHFAGAGWKSLSIPKGQSAAHGRGSFKEQFVRPART